MMGSSPCLTCTRTKNPAECENKQCSQWRAWYMERWAKIHGYYEKAMAARERAEEEREYELEK